jgi:hypothetical protein
MLSAYSKNNERSERVGREHIESGQYFCAAASRASLNRLMFRPVNPMRKILRHVNFTQVVFVIRTPQVRSAESVTSLPASSIAARSPSAERIDS